MKQANVYLGNFLNFVFNDIVTHIPVHIIRLCFLRTFNKKIASSAVILMHARILNFWNFTIGAHSIINQYVLIDCRRYPVIIEDNVDIGPYTRIWTLSHDPNNELHEVKGGSVILRHHVWIASGVTILPLVTLEEGVVVATGSVVTKSVPAKHIVAGVPAVKIGERINPLTYRIQYTPIFE